MTQIAVYGKGGIGKSTITANLSVALAEKGFRVLQIGCDPKHDSTRLLLHGFMQNTVLDQLKSKKPEEIYLDEIMLRGYRGVCCIEAGGPEPGVGCAGRGIISMASLLKRIGLKKEEFDYIIYDVLGDVVCGGFGVPMRDGYADRILVVTSGEMMSIYAANNICKGIRNASHQRGKLGGVIGNARNVENEDVLIADFAGRVGSRMVEFFPRDELFRQCELKSQTVMEYAPDSEVADLFRGLADTIPQIPTVTPDPLSEERLENLLVGFYQQRKPTATQARVAGIERKRGRSSLDEKQEGDDSRNPGDDPDFEAYFKKPKPSAGSAYLSKSVRNKEPFHSCALQGAFNVTSQVLDAISVMHSSINCSHIGFHAMLSVSKLHRLQKNSRSASVPQLFSSNMGETEMVFGGEKLLGQSITKLKSLLEPAAVFLINSCPAAIIGDDPVKVARLHASNDCPVVAVKADGVNEGDYAQGMLNAYMALAEALIDNQVEPKKNQVNLVGEKNASTVVEENYSCILELLTALELEVNCRFVRQTSAGQIGEFHRAPFSLLVETDDTARTLQKFLQDQFSVNFIAAAPPIGLTQTQRWIEQIAHTYGKQRQAERVIGAISSQYERSLAELKTVLKNKRVLIFTYLQELDWLLETLADLEMSVEKLCLYNSCVKESFSSRLGEIAVETDYPGCRRDQDIEQYRPDLVLSNYLPPRMIEGITYSVIPLCPKLGWSAGIDHAHVWARNIRIPFVEGWRYDQKLFPALP
ncbi:AAA family ATPase [Acidobacteria bacterium AH-259-O06]|nr:AAA family ATPase [Acidobacteria bacterium AH-259-O06]